MNPLLAALPLLLALPAAGTESQLWGKTGEAWDPAGRLPDFSYAGYACGERPIPEFPVLANVRDLGARGDGTSDDTAAFKKAVAAVAGGGQPGTVAIPPGRYLIRDIIEINKPGIVLRGAGAGRSWIVCDTPLEKIRPNMGQTTGGRPTSNYSWSGGIIWFKGRQAGGIIGAVKGSTTRGSHEIQVENLAKANLNPGDWIEVRLRDDPQKSLLCHLYSDDPGNTSKIKPGSHRTHFVSRVRHVAGDRLSIERPLRTDLRAEWKPELRHFQPSVHDCGIEDLGFQFPARTYQGHFSELGFNAVAMSGVANCWARRLLLVNSDSGLFISGGFCTVSDLRCELQGSRESNRHEFGHHGISMTGHDNLLTRFDIQQRFVHDITVSKGPGNVSSCGCGIDLCFDHHKRAPYENLFTDLDLGEGSRMWKCGGGGDLGRHCGARGTFWNIRAKRPQKHPGDFGPASMNLVGLETRENSSTDPGGRWFEAIPPADLQPQNLHQAQWEKRMGVMK